MQVEMNVESLLHTEKKGCINKTFCICFMLAQTKYPRVKKRQ